MIEINLIPDVKQEFLRAQRMRNAAVSFSIMIGIIAAGIVGFLALLLGAQLVHENVQKTRLPVSLLSSNLSMVSLTS